MSRWTVPGTSLRSPRGFALKPLFYRKGGIRASIPYARTSQEAEEEAEEAGAEEAEQRPLSPQILRTRQSLQEARLPSRVGHQGLPRRPFNGSDQAMADPHSLTFRAGPLQPSQSARWHQEIMAPSSDASLPTLQEPPPLRTRTSPLLLAEAVPDAITQETLCDRTCSYAFHSTRLPGVPRVTIPPRALIQAR